MTPVVRFGGVELTYPGPPPVTALRKTDLIIDSGEYVTVVGPSGSGKSTFLNIVGLLDRPTGGSYELDGIDVGHLDEAARAGLRAHRIGFVFQAFHLMGYRSALENVALALVYTGAPARQRLDRAAEALDRVGLAAHAHKPPSELSGGERQRVAIARALVGDPSLLLCDEPTGNLDSITADGILRLLDEVHRQGYTIIVITHDAAVARRGTRTMTIKDGGLDG